MTREKAIEILKEIIEEGWLISDFDKCIAIDACEMAIKALEQETVSKESYDHEYFLRKELELKVAILEKQIAEQKPKSEWEHDHEILKAYAEGADNVLEKIRTEIDNTLSDGMIHKKTVLGIIDKYKTESEK